MYKVIAISRSIRTKTSLCLFWGYLATTSMGKMGASSWLSAVKKALSPTKGSEKQGEKEEENHKGFLQKRGKKRWIFRKPSPYERTIEHKETKNIASPCDSTTTKLKNTDHGNLALRLPLYEEVTVSEQRQAMVVTLATTAASEVAFATPKAAVGVLRFVQSSNMIPENFAAVAIQTAFRAYLARRALKALKGVVQLQAFVRGYNVRKRAKMTLQCMQSLLRVQNQVCDQRKRLSLSPLKNHYQLAETKSNSRSSNSSVTDDEYLPHKSKEATIKRESSLAYAFSRQIWRLENPHLCLNKHQEERSTHNERFKTFETDVTCQHLLINSLASPHRSRTRGPKPESPLFEASPMPRYMAETEATSARMRSQSAPRRRPKLDRDREGSLCSAKKRLSFTV